MVDLFELTDSVRLSSDHSWNRFGHKHHRMLSAASAAAFFVKICEIGRAYLGGDGRVVQTVPIDSSASILKGAPFMSIETIVLRIESFVHAPVSFIKGAF